LYIRFPFTTFVAFSTPFQFNGSAALLDGVPNG
jgi:hypothetical protein